MHEQLQGLLEKGPWAAWRQRPGGVFLLRGDGMPEAERVVLLAAARAVLSGERGDLAAQLDLPHPEPRWPATGDETCARDGRPREPSRRWKPRRSRTAMGREDSPRRREYAIVLEATRIRLCRG
jgi:hypothetical protein